jgi:hypothetical protein
MPRISLRCLRKKYSSHHVLNFSYGAVARGLHGGVERQRIRIVLGAAAIEHRGQIGAAAEPRFRGHHEARVHVHRRHMRIVHVRDHRHARRPEARIVRGARDLRAEFGRELAVHGRAMHADLLEHAAVHHRHHAAAAGCAGEIRALPRRAHEASRRAIGQRRARRQRIFQRFERGADVVAQLLEPGACAGLSVGDHAAASSTLAPQRAATSSPRSRKLRACAPAK